MSTLKSRTLAATLLTVAILAGVFYLFRGKTERMPAISLKKYNEGGYSLSVDNRPYFIKGVCYLPTPIGENVHYNFWAHPEIWRTDAKLMKAMGANTVRFYREGEKPAEVRAVIKGLHQDFGIRSLMGHDLGFWDWPPPNYALPEFRDKVKKDVLRMVEEYKNEPGLLAWILGNENNYSFEMMHVQSWSTPELEAIEDPAVRSRAKAEIYYAFVDELAREIKAKDPVHPIVMGAGEVRSLDVAAQKSTNIDILGLNVYRGAGFGNLFGQVKEKFDKPVILMEWGADSFDAKAGAEDQDKQAEFIKLQWRDIERNSTLKSERGTCLGGTLFEWSDEWWKANEHVADTWKAHDKTGQFSNAAYYYDYGVADHQNMNEEWWGVVSVSPKSGNEKVDKRTPKKSYEVLKEFWTSKQ